MKHGPKGSGLASPCDADCAKCAKERLDNMPDASEAHAHDALNALVQSYDALNALIQSYKMRLARYETQLAQAQTTIDRLTAKAKGAAIVENPDGSLTVTIMRERT